MNLSRNSYTCPRETFPQNLDLFDFQLLSYERYGTDRRTDSRSASRTGLPRGGSVITALREKLSIIRLRLRHIAGKLERRQHAFKQHVVVN